MVKYNPKIAIDIMKLGIVKGSKIIAISAAKTGDLDTLKHVMLASDAPEPDANIAQEVFDKPEMIQWIIDQGYPISELIFLKFANSDKLRIV